MLPYSMDCAVMEGNGGGRWSGAWRMLAFCVAAHHAHIPAAWPIPAVHSSFSASYSTSPCAVHNCHAILVLSKVGCSVTLCVQLFRVLLSLSLSLQSTCSKSISVHQKSHHMYQYQVHQPCKIIPVSSAHILLLPAQRQSHYCHNSIQNGKVTVTGNI
mgnify:CR=1 FL=1